MIIQAQQVKKVYRNGLLRVEALNGINMQVEEGEMVAIMGPSGCGKTTLLNCLSGLDTIDEGNVFIKGDNLRDLSDNERTAYRARHMGFIFQDFNLLPVLSAVENVELPMLVSRAGNLDSETAEDIMSLICRLNRENGQTFVIVTHDIEVGKLANRIFTMRDGEIV